MDWPSGDHLALSASVEIAVSLLRVAGGAGGGVEVGEPDLLATVSAGKEEHGLPSGANWRPLSPGWADGERLIGISAGDGLEPQLRCFGVLVEIRRW